MTTLRGQRIDFKRNSLEFLRDGRGIYGLDFRMKRNDQSMALIIRPETFAERVRLDDCYVFSARKGGERIATIEIVSTFEGLRLGQFSSPCNQPVDKKVERIIRKWAKSTKFRKEEARSRPELQEGMEYLPVWANAGGDLDAEIPF